MANELTISSVRSLLDQLKPQIQMALPRHVTADRLIRVALTQVRRTPKLLQCTQESLLGAIVQSAQLGLEPDAITGFAYLVPYGRECTLIPGYKGLMDLAWRSKMVGAISPVVVNSRDEFYYELGLNPKVHHVPSMSADPGAPIFYYAIAEIIGAQSKPFRVMSREQIEAVKNRSQSAKSGFSPWKTDYDAMAMKTVIRRLLKYCPQSVELQRAIALDEHAELNLPQNLGDVIDVPESAATPQQVKAGEVFKGDAQE